MKLIVSLLALFSVTAAHAGHVTGNGGDAIVCRDTFQNVESAELLDFYEARTERNFPSNLDSSRSMDENLDILFQRLTHYDSYMRDRLQTFRTSWRRESVFLPGIELVDVPDSGHISFPRGCKVEQVAIQKEPKFPGDKRYTFNQDIWDKFDGANRAGLILHELLYRQTIEGSKKSEIDSRAVRFYTSLVAAERWDVLNHRDYIDLIREEFGIEYTNIDGYLVLTKSVAFDQHGNVVRYRTHFEQSVPIQLASGLTLTAAANSEFGHSYNRQTGIHSYDMWPEQSSFTVNGIVFTLSNKYLGIDVDANGLVVGLSGVTFKWKSYYWPQEDLLACDSITLAPPPSGKLVCNKIHLDLLYGVSPLNFTELTFSLGKQIVSARVDYQAMGNSPAVSAEFTFYPTQAYQSIVCTGDTSNPLRMPTFAVFYPDSNHPLLCYPGAGRIDFYQTGNIRNGGISILDFKINGHEVSARYGYGCQDGKRNTRPIPVYQGYETGMPMHALLKLENSFIAYRSDGTPIELKNGDYVRLDENGAITAHEADYCAHH